MLGIEHPVPAQTVQGTLRSSFLLVGFCTEIITYYKLYVNLFC